MRNIWRLGLKGRLLIFVLLTFLPAFTLSSINSLHQLDNQKAATNLSIMRLARMMKLGEQQMLESGREFLIATSTASAVVGDDLDKCRALMNRVVQKFHAYVSFGVATPDGNVICKSASSNLQGNIATLTFFKDAVSRASFGIGRYEIDSSTGKPMVYLAYPVFVAENSVSKYIFSALDLSQINNFAPAAQLEPNSVVKIFDQSGLILDRFPDLTGRSGTLQPDMPLLKQIRRRGEEGVVDAELTDGVRRVFGYTTIHTIPGQTVYLAVGLSHEAAYGVARHAFQTEMGSLFIVSLMVLAFAWFGSDVLVLRKMQKVVEAADRIRGGDLNARCRLENDHDELAHLGDAVDAMADVMQNRVVDLQRHDEEMRELMEMNEAMQACTTQDEVLAVVREYLGRLFPVYGGALYLLHESGEYLEEKLSWNNPASKREFPLDECWAMRRGQNYVVDKESGKPGCPHVMEPKPQSGMCLPLLIHGQTLGMLHLQDQDGTLPKSDREPGSQQLANSVAEHITLVLANLRLNDMLRVQATRDSLTGLFNRRFMEESLIRETRNAERNHSCVSIIMLDLDHFKHFNDTFGHAAGDALLREVGRLLLTKMRGGDLACRYGGEEFTILLPGTPLEKAFVIAEALRQAVREMKVDFLGKALGAITASIGVACYPKHGKTWEIVMHAADIALLQAKEKRNCVVVCENCLGEFLH